jgi:hypothetical protein
LIDEKYKPIATGMDGISGAELRLNKGFTNQNMTDDFSALNRLRYA